MNIKRLAKKLDLFESKSTQPLEVSLSEAQSIIQSKSSSPLPFAIPQKAKETIQAEMDKYNEIQAEADTLLKSDTKPKIE